MIMFESQIDLSLCQGSIVCIFYCVLSNDVQMAVTKRWYQFKVRREHKRDHSRQDQADPATPHTPNIFYRHEIFLCHNAECFLSYVRSTINQPSPRQK